MNECKITVVSDSHGVRLADSPERDTTTIIKHSPESNGQLLTVFPWPGNADVYFSFPKEFEAHVRTLRWVSDSKGSETRLVTIDLYEVKP